MVFALADELAKHLRKGFHPATSPLLRRISTVLCAGLTQALKQVGLPTNAVRRRASPREEPRVRAWLFDLVGVGSSRLGHFPDDV